MVKQYEDLSNNVRLEMLSDLNYLTKISEKFADDCESETDFFDIKNIKP
jgi:hypothetical protein